MTPECLIKLKTVVSDDVYAKLADAQKRDSNFDWDSTMQEAHADMQLLRRSAIIDANKKIDLTGYINKQAAAGIKPQQAISDIISGSGARQSSGIVSLDKKIDHIRGQYLSDLVDLIHSTRPKFLGIGRKGGSEYTNNLVKNIFGDADAGGAGKGLDKMADAWAKVSKSLLDRFNRAGGSITEFEKFALPTNHYAPAIRKAKRTKWVEDADKYFVLRNPDGGEFVGAKRMKILNNIYDNLARENPVKLDPKKVGELSGVKIGEVGQEFRWLQPKNGEAWLDYNKKYGRHDHPVDAMVEYVDGMATKIGAMETLGTNPNKMLDDIVEQIRKETGNRQAGAWAKSSMDQIISRNPGYDSKITDTLRGFRNFQTATKLTMAPITALSDPVFSSITAVYNGMNPVNVFTRQMKLLNPFDHADRKLAGEMGLLMDYALSKAVALNRYSDTNAYGALHRVADISTRASGLNHWTNSGKTAFQMEFLANMARFTDKPYGSMPKGLRGAFDRYGISEADWTTIRKATRTDATGRMTYIDPSKIVDDDLGAKVVGMIREELNFAVPEPNVKARAAATLGIPTNTVASEIIKVGTQFKSFGVSIMLSHMGRMLDQQTMAARVGYGASLLMGSAMIGTAIVQLKDLAKGREARELSPELIMEGIMQGGALGVAGDAIFTNPDLFGGTAAYLAGPTVSDWNNLLKVLWSTKTEAESKSVARAWERELRPSIAKGATDTFFPAKMWFWRIAQERLWLDQANKWADPQYSKKQRNRKKWLKEERGQDMWWKPGQSFSEATR